MSTPSTPPPADDFPDLPGLHDADELLPMTPAPLAPKPIRGGKKKAAQRKGRRGKREEAPADAGDPQGEKTSPPPEEAPEPADLPSPAAAAPAEDAPESPAPASSPPKEEELARDTRPERPEHFPALTTKLKPLEELDLEDGLEIPAAKDASPTTGAPAPVEPPVNETVPEPTQMAGEESMPATESPGDHPAPASSRPISAPPAEESPETSAPAESTTAEGTEILSETDEATGKDNPATADGVPAPADGEEDGPTLPEETPPVSNRDLLRRMIDGFSPAERRWLAILGGGLLVVAAVFYFLLRGGLPTENPHQATLTPSLPVQGQKISVEEVEIGWLDRGANSLAGGINAMTLFPEATLGFGPQSNGAVRVFFRDERGRQVGDTVSFEVRGGKVGPEARHRITCTEGLRSQLDYDDLRARGDVHWTLEIHEGTDPFGSLSGFTLLAKISIPWNLGTHP